MMVDWYKHDIPDWMDGTEALDAEPYRTYHVVCQLIYLHEGPIALNEHGIAGRCKQSIRTFRASLKILLDLGKLTLSDGRLTNFRAKKELEKVSENRLNASEGGKKSSEVRNSRSKSLENNTTSQATLQNSSSLIEKTREEENREEKKDPTLRVASDPRTRLFSEGLAKLASLTGRGPDACRSFVGKCLKAADDDAVTVLGLIEEAERNRVANPAAWIAARLKGPQDGKAGSRIIQAADDLCRKIASFDGPAGPDRELRGTEGEAPLILLSHG